MNRFADEHYTSVRQGSYKVNIEVKNLIINDVFECNEADYTSYKDSFPTVFDRWIVDNDGFRGVIRENQRVFQFGTNIID